MDDLNQKSDMEQNLSCPLLWKGVLCLVRKTAAHSLVWLKIFSTRLVSPGSDWGTSIEICRRSKETNATHVSDDVILTCAAGRGEILPVVTWSKKDGDLPPVLGNGTVAIDKA